uniref:Mab-21-like nucleotidyltransferase domain-containing protein n=1 Tax=Larimichthys crocea TaxID=215358 RepID=A0A0F8C1Y4_LARCR
MHLKQNTVCFKEVEEPLRTGSYYENLKISNPDEFDVMLPIPVGRVDIKSVRRGWSLLQCGIKTWQEPTAKVSRGQHLIREQNAPGVQG